MRKFLTIFLIGFAFSGCEDDARPTGALLMFEPDLAPMNGDASTHGDADRSSDAQDMPASDIGVPSENHVIEIGPIDLPEGRSEVIEFELPDDIDSIVVIAQGDPTVMYGIEHLEGPGGQVLVAEEPEGVQLTAWDRQISPFPGPFYSPNRSASASTEVATLLAPNNPTVSVSPGLWNLRLGAIGLFGRVTTDAEVKILLKTGRPSQALGTLDLHFHFTGALGAGPLKMRPRIQIFSGRSAAWENFIQP